MRGRGGRVSRRGGCVLKSNKSRRMGRSRRGRLAEAQQCIKGALDSKSRPVTLENTTKTCWCAALSGTAWSSRLPNSSTRKTVFGLGWYHKARCQPRKGPDNLLPREDEPNGLVNLRRRRPKKRRRRGQKKRPQKLGVERGHKEEEKK